MLTRGGFSFAEEACLLDAITTSIVVGSCCCTRSLSVRQSPWLVATTILASVSSRPIATVGEEDCSRVSFAISSTRQQPEIRERPVEWRPRSQEPLDKKE
ncbi:hypothetical protein BS78_05G035700 [Paspalum vaginatum]|nr:hypothetical protein BS78_05G035700 [Paspalum vaginatum]